MKILFIGGSGMLGEPVARELISAGHTVTFLARDTQKMRNLFPSSMIMQGDVMDRTSLNAACAKQDIIYMNLSVAQLSKKNDPQPEREGLANVIAAARQAGVQRLGYISSLVKNYEGMNGYHWWAFVMKHKAIEALKNSGIPYSVFYPSTFFETLDRQMAQGNKLMMIGDSKFPMWFIAAADYAKQVVKAFSIAGNNNQEYAIQGPEAFTFNEAAKIFIQHYKKPLKIMKAPAGFAKLLGWFNQKMNYAAHICEALNKYPEKFESEKTWADLGKPSITLKQYASSL